MSFCIDTDPEFISMALDRVMNLNANEYLIVFGPDGKQFLATPNGYSATYLPSRIIAELTGGAAEKVVWVSYGDAPDSWFFSYRIHGGQPVVRLGDGSPAALHSYINRLKETSQELLGAVRVQLGAHDSFVVWTGTTWACYNIPAALRRQLNKFSSGSRESHGLTMGSLQQGTVANIQWHSDGSFYFRHQDHPTCWNFQSAIARDAWQAITRGQRDSISNPQLSTDLAYVAIDAHAPTSETFAFIKTSETGEEASFVLHFAEEPIHANLTEHVEQGLQYLDSIPDDRHFRWAVSVKTGRSHNDGWELDLKKGQRIRVLKEEDRNWFVVVDQKGRKGFVHGSYLDFEELKKDKDSEVAWKKFEEDTDNLFESRNITDFLDMRDYIDTCTSPSCQARKQDLLGLGICHHDLEELLKGSGKYYLEWLKEERNMWHPDRFARFCMPEHAESLKVKAQELFVLYGLLMEQF